MASECVQLCEMATAGGERRFDMLHPQIQTRERVLAFPAFSFFTHLQFFSARCHLFTERSVGGSSKLVHCQTVNVLRDVGLISFRQRKTLCLSLLEPGQILFVVRYYLSDDLAFFFPRLHSKNGFIRSLVMECAVVSLLKLWLQMRAGFQEYPCTCRKGIPF